MEETKRCNRCNRDLILKDNFYYRKESKHRRAGYLWVCKNCSSEIKTEYKQTEKGKAHHNARARHFYWANAEQCKKAERERNQKYRQEVLEHYGNKCACCGETIEEFLSIDHIKNDGCLCRQNEGGGGMILYKYLRKNNFPEGYQTLCLNCNFGKARNHGVCPHKGIIQPDFSTNPPTAIHDNMSLFSKNYRRNFIEARRQRWLAWQELKHEVYNHYSNDKIKCICCHETIEQFLSLDHINNDGAEHRREINMLYGGARYYSWLKKTNYQTELQILCMNCNLGRAIKGGSCPHLSINSIL